MSYTTSRQMHNFRQTDMSGTQRNNNKSNHIVRNLLHGNLLLSNLLRCHSLRFLKIKLLFFPKTFKKQTKFKTDVILYFLSFPVLLYINCLLQTEKHNIHIIPDALSLCSTFSCLLTRFPGRKKEGRKMDKNRERVKVPDKKGSFLPSLCATSGKEDKE